jgi:hypothetical protein
MWCLGWFLNQEYALVDSSYSIGLTPAENSQVQIG